MFPRQPTDKQIIGKVGEDLACDYLRGNGYKVIDRNYLKKWGEIDVVATKSGKIHFVEVKTVSRDTSWFGIQNVSQETTGYRPEDNLHSWKLQRLGRVIQSYLVDRNVSDETEWVFDVITVYLDKDKRLFKIEMIGDLVL